MGASLDCVRCKVKPESEWTFTVSFKAPELPGRYTSFFRLQTGNIKFGHKTQIDIMVVEPKKEEEEQKVGEILGDKNDCQTRLAPEPFKQFTDSLTSSLMKMSNSDIKTPKQVYMGKA